MAEMKEFDTLIVGSASCAVMLDPDGDRHDIHVLAEHVLGHPIWSHELYDNAIWVRISDAIRAHLPDMPELHGDDVEGTDWKAVGASLIERYGKTVSIPKGSQVPTEDPIQSINRIFPGKPVVGVVVPE